MPDEEIDLPVPPNDPQPMTFDEVVFAGTVPKGSMPVCSIVMTLFLHPSGHQSFSYRYVEDSDLPLSTYMGLIEMVKARALFLQNWKAAQDPDMEDDDG